MNFILRYALVLVFLVTTILNGAQPKSTKPYLEPYKKYYIKSVLDAVPNDKRHAAMKIIIDFNNAEPEDTLNIALQGELALSLQDEQFPVLVSGYLLKNLLIRTRPYDPNHPHSKNVRSIELRNIINQGAFIASNWDIYDVPESKLVLLVPQKYSLNYAGKNMGLKPLPSLNHLLPPKFTNFIHLSNYPYTELITWLANNKAIEPLKPEISFEEFNKKFGYNLAGDLNKIFINKLDDSTPIWDFFISGHGSNNPYIIAGIIPSSFNTVLDFFDKKIKTGIIYVLSCSSGGELKTILETTKDGVQTNHNFIFILGSISNSIVITSLGLHHERMNIFLNNAGYIQDKGSSINNLIRQLVYFNPTEDSPHGATAFPQIWFPGGYGFQTPQIINGTLALGNVFLKTHKENNQPITIDIAIIVLLYPQIIDVPLIISPINMGRIIQKDFKNYIFVFEDLFFTNSSDQMRVINGLKAEKVLPDYLSQLPVLAQVSNAANPNYYLYPQFISMSPKTADYLFSNISISTQLQGKQVAQGVLQFIRDAFFDPSKKSDHTYYIDYLSGTNDISLTLAASRLLANVKDKHPLEQILKDRINEKIILKNVIIDPKNIIFEIDNTAWLIRPAINNDPTKQMRWDFKSIDAKEYEQTYKNTVEKLLAGKLSSQKSISEVLYEKQRQVLLKKAVELKQKQEEIDKAKKAAEPKPVVTPGTITPKSTQPTRALPTPIKPLPKTVEPQPSQPKPVLPPRALPTPAQPKSTPVTPVSPTPAPQAKPAVPARKLPIPTPTKATPAPTQPALAAPKTIQLTNAVNYSNQPTVLTIHDSQTKKPTQYFINSSQNNIPTNLAINSSISIQKPFTVQNRAAAMFYRIPPNNPNVIEVSDGKKIIQTLNVADFTTSSLFIASNGTIELKPVSEPSKPSAQAKPRPMPVPSTQPKTAITPAHRRALPTPPK